MEIRNYINVCLGSFSLDTWFQSFHSFSKLKDAMMKFMDKVDSELEKYKNGEINIDSKEIGEVWVEMHFDYEDPYGEYDERSIKVHLKLYESEDDYRRRMETEKNAKEFGERRLLEELKAKYEK